ncbi:MAG: molecular chaperone DnaJ [Deltaproteobacteria bacterium]|nr:molecular chaperone DnaJ [Deltaproteobacteria bacterium]
MSKRIDYYEFLEVSRDANGDEVKKAYRSAAMKWHPDRNQGNREAEENFKLASEAYEVLSDPQKRELYDRYGHDGLSGSNFHPFNNVEDIFESFGDVFEDFFGFGGMGGRSRRGQGGRRPRAGEDLAYALNIEFEEAYHGCEKEIQIHKTETCADCEGKGHPASSKPSTCPQCKGQGQVFHSQGFFTISSPCQHCRGQGVIIKVLCHGCQGKGRVKREKKLNVKVPAGVDQGNRLVLRQEGEAGSDGGPAGDLYVVLQIKEHPLFKRDENNLWMDLPISFTQAALGATLKVPTMDGEQEVEIPSGIESGETITLKGKGFPFLRDSRHGNQILKIFVKTPKKLSAKQEELLREFAKESGESEEEVSKIKPKKKKKFLF